MIVVFTNNTFFATRLRGLVGIKSRITLCLGYYKYNASQEKECMLVFGTETFNRNRQQQQTTRFEILTHEVEPAPLTYCPFVHPTQSFTSSCFVTMPSVSVLKVPRGHCKVQREKKKNQ
jgi:hypothetical protein|tara:strand:+ start:65 stop:421 length:357 start_codon:yes stop_codon:yes gene_type:complete